MTLKGSFLWGALGHGTVYFCVGRAVWPGDRSLGATIGVAIVWGFLMQAWTQRRVGRIGPGKDRYPPVPTIGLALLFLIALALYWKGLDAPLTGVDLVVSAGIAPMFCLYLLYRGIMSTRRNRASLNSVAS